MRSNVILRAGRVAIVLAAACTPDFGELVKDGADSGSKADGSAVRVEAGREGSAGNTEREASAGTGGGSVADAAGEQGRGDANGTGGAGVAADSSDARETSIAPRDASIDVSVDAPDASYASDARVAIADATRERDGAPRLRDASGCAATGYALQLNGSSFVTIARPVQDDFTLEAWMQTATPSTGQYFYQGTPLFYADLSSSGANDFTLAIVNDRLIFVIGNPDSGANGTTVVVTSDWVHVAATREKATGRLQLFVNGTLDTVSYGNAMSLVDPPTISIGGTPGSSTGLTGLIDEVRLWQTVRTPAEIAANMFTPLRGDEPGLVGYYPFDENGGTVAFDSSLSENHGRMTGQATWVPSDAPMCGVLRDASSRDARIDARPVDESLIGDAVSSDASVEASQELDGAGPPEGG